MNKQDELKAKELCDQLYGGCKDYIGKRDLFSYLISMSAWKEQQMIEKAVEWLNEWLTDDVYQCRIPLTKSRRDEFFKDFKRAMMEE